MKHLAYILSIYLFVLACLPCSDSSECGDYALASQAAQADTHQDHSHDTEACSPFCFCACCGTQVPQFSFTAALLPGPSLSIQKPVQPVIYKTAMYGNYCGSIWQPPRAA